MASVTTPVALGGDGQIYSDDANPSTGLMNGGHLTRFIPLLSSIVGIANQVVNTANSFSARTYAVFQDQKAYNVAGGTSVAGANIRNSLNTTAINNIPGCSLVAGQVQVANAGTYEIHAKAAGQTSQGHVLQIVQTNTSGGAIVQTNTGTSEFTNGGYSTAECCGRFTVTQGTTFVLKHYLYSAVTTSGLGNAHNLSGITNVSVELEIEKVG